MLVKSDKIEARIIGLGKFLPEKLLTNADLEKKVATSDEWIVTRTGIKERRIASSDEPTSFLGVKAAEIAIKQAEEKTGFKAEEIDLVICATMTPDYITPSTAAIIQKELGLTHVPAYDMQAACTGFIYALSQAKAFIESGLYKNILIVASEKMSSVIDYEDRNTCVLFGDGAAAAVVSSNKEGWSVDSLTLGADGEQSRLIIIPGGGSRQPATEDSVKNREHFVKMEGKETYKHAVRRMTASIKECLIKAELEEGEVSWLVPHQANRRIIDAIAGSFNIPEDKIFLTLHKYGNTSGSSVAIALTELCEEKDLKINDHLLLVAFGAGLTWGACILTKKGNS